MKLRTAIKQTIWQAMRVPLLSRAVIRYYQHRPPLHLPGWNKEHPFDRENGVQTSGVLPGAVLGAGTTCYGAAQPSIIRHALALVPEPQTCHFLDFGCGKGRPLFVATEFDFHKITGIEFSPPLVRIARENIAAFSRNHRDRQPITIVETDVLEYHLPEEKLVIFLYNPFVRSLMVELIKRIEASLLAVPRDLYIVYYNPVCADVVDVSTALERRYAGQVPYARDELGFGPQTSDAVIIWQNRGNLHPALPGDQNAGVSVVAPGLLVKLSN
jgi:SAM-dependent methyltransferase